MDAPPFMTGYKPKKRKIKNINFEKKMAKLEPSKDPKDPFAFRPPFRMLVCAGSGGGKTAWLIKWLVKKRYMVFDQIIWVTDPGSMHQPKFKILREQYGPFITFVEHINAPQIEELIDYGYEQDEPWETLVVFDDLLLESGKTDYVAKLGVSGRHRHVSTVCLQQKIFSDKGRTFRLQTDYNVIGTFPVCNEAAHLFQQMTMSKFDRDLLQAAYKKITRKPKHFMILDSKAPKSPELPLRVRDTELDNLIPELWDV